MPPRSPRRNCSCIVHEVGDLAQHREPVPEADRNPQRSSRSSVSSLPPSRRTSRVPAQVDDDVVDHPAHRTVLPGCVWKWMARNVPWRSASRCPRRSPSDAVARAVSARNVSTKKPPSPVHRRVRAGPGAGSQAVGYAEKRLGTDRRRTPRHAEDRTSPRRPRPPTPPTYTSARFDEFSRWRKNVAQYVVDHLDKSPSTPPRNSPAGRTPRRQPWCASVSLGLEASLELQEATARVRPPPPDGERRRSRHAATQPRPVVVEQAVAADHVKSRTPLGGVALGGRGRDQAIAAPNES